MLTVLFVMAVLFGCGAFLSVLDGHASSGEVASYLHCEYNFAQDQRATMSLLRNL